MKTPQQSYPGLAKALGVEEIYLKREDLHKYGSHKGRSIPLMIKTYVKQGFDNFVISSSGNAALAAIKTVSQHNRNNPGIQIKLTVLVGKNIDNNKLKKLQAEVSGLNSKIEIKQVERPKQIAFQMDKDKIAKSLRQSTDDLALEGYISLAEELSKIKDLSAVFVPTSSGTTAQALAQFFLDNDLNVEVHVVQTEACHTISDCFSDNKGVTKASSSETSIASAIVDKVAHRKEKLAELIKKTNGTGWIASNQNIEKAMKLVADETKITISPNSALSVAGLILATRDKYKFSGSIVCLVTGN